MRNPITLLGHFGCCSNQRTLLTSKALSLIYAQAYDEQCAELAAKVEERWNVGQKGLKSAKPKNPSN